MKEEIPYKPGQNPFIGCYQRAVTTVHKKMNKKDLKEVDKTVELWNKDGAPSDVQLK